MTPEQIKAAVEALTPLAEKLGTTVEYIYAVYRAYQWYYAVANLVSLLITASAMLVAWGLVFRWVLRSVREETRSYKERVKEDYRAENMDYAYIIGGAIGGIAITVAILWLGTVAEDSYLRLTNPDYYALQAMLKLVGK